MGSKEKMSSFLSQQADVVVDQAITEARQRILDLLDKDSFVELGSQIESLVPTALGREGVAGEGLISGYGQIDNRLVFVASQDISVYHGGVGQANSAKLIRTLDLAIEANSPFIVLWDSGGIRVDEGLLALDAVGTIYQRFLDARALIPIVSLVVGPCPGSLSMLPTASDLLVMSADKGGVFLQGPGITAAEENPQLKTGDIGGASVHSQFSGLAALVADTVAETIVLTRQLMTYLPDNSNGFLWSIEGQDDPNRSELELDQIAASLDDGYEIRDILDAVFDHDSVLELYADFATELNAGFARLSGQPVIYLANAENEMGADAATKIERLLGLADRLNYPLVSFTDTIGFKAGSEMEKLGISECASRVMAAFSNCEVARLNVVIGQAIGQGYLVFNSKPSGASMVYAWPTAEIGAMRADSAVHLFHQNELAALDDPIRDREALVEAYRTHEMSPMKAASQGAIDEVIRPSATRPRLYSALQLLLGL